VGGLPTQCPERSGIAPGVEVFAAPDGVFVWACTAENPASNDTSAMAEDIQLGRI